MNLGEATLRLLMEPLSPFLTDPTTTEIVINRPGKVRVEAGSKWALHDVTELDFDHLDAIGVLAGVQTHQDFGPAKPSCSSVLPGGFRIQIARPPITSAGQIGITIRKRATSFVPTLDFLHSTGYFGALDPETDWVHWFRERVVRYKTFLIGGRTGSGKTTLAEALLREIPLHERVLTIEKTAEFVDLPHGDGWFAQYYGYSGDGAGSERAAVHLLESVLRQRPDRIIFGELRSAGEAWAYLRGLKAGHPGGITTIHSGSAQGTIKSLATMMRGDAAAVGMDDAHIREEIRENVDVLVHCDRDPYRITEVVEIARD